MKDIIEADFDRNTILAIHAIPEEELMQFVQTYDPKASMVQAIAYYPAAEKYFIKYMNGRMSRYILADFDGKRFIDNPDFSLKKTWSGEDVKTMYRWNGTNVKVWIVWGGI